MTQIWLNYASIHPWDDAEKWTAFFDQAQHALGSPLTRLDTSDPIKRRVRSLAEAGEYASQVLPGRDITSIFGRFEEIDFEFTIEKHKDHALWPNYLIMCTSAAAPFELNDGMAKVQSLFQVGIKHLSPFYAYCDDISYVRSRKPQRRAVDIRAELVGVFWLTFFGKAYVEFFGEKKFAQFPRYQFDEFGGVTVQLSENPAEILPELRNRFVDLLGEDSFVDPSSDRRKPPGQFALTLEELINFELAVAAHG